MLRKTPTLAETFLWQKIRKRVFNVQFHRQVPMLDYIVDFYCHEIGLAIEVDGKIHEHKYFYDARRQGRLEKEGVIFLRFTNEEIKQQMVAVLHCIETKVSELLDE